MAVGQQASDQTHDNTVTAIDIFTLGNLHRGQINSTNDFSAFFPIHSICADFHSFSDRPKLQNDFLNKTETVSKI